MADVTRACARLAPCSEPSSPTASPGPSPGCWCWPSCCRSACGSSEAAFVAAHDEPRLGCSAAAASFNTVAVTLTDPGTPLRGTVMLNAVATSDRGISSRGLPDLARRREHLDDRLHATTLTPYSCTWDTTTVADGLRDIRAVATDTRRLHPDLHGHQPPRRQHRRRPRPPPIPGTPLTGTVSVTGRRRRLRLRRREHDACSTARPAAAAGPTSARRRAATATCSWNTASLADGLYDVRTVATDVAGNPGTPSAVVANRRLDNNAPTATMTAPAANLTGSVTLPSTSADAANGTGVASVRYEYKPSAGSTWVTACTGLGDAVLVLVQHRARSPTASTTSAPSRSTASTRPAPRPR